MHNKIRCCAEKHVKWSQPNILCFHCNIRIVTHIITRLRLHRPLSSRLCINARRAFLRASARLICTLLRHFDDKQTINMGYRQRRGRKLVQQIYNDIMSPTYGVRNYVLDEVILHLEEFINLLLFAFWFFFAFKRNITCCISVQLLLCSVNSIIDG